MWEIRGKNNQVKTTVGSLEYNGEWMGESYVTVTVESPAPVNFEIGDYIIYRDERFEINYDPGKIKSAPRYEKGDAFKYENIKFNSLADELTRCDFLDIVLNDNQLHFTGLPKFSFYGGVKDLANRMQANLDRTYGKGTWSVVVSPEFQSTKEVNISVDTIKVQGALSILVNELETYYTIKDRTITIGAAGIPAGHLFKYGKGNGLYEIEQNAEADQAIVTRLRAYGSTRNLPHRYYNSLSGADGKKLIPDNMAVQYLMLPEFPYTTQDPYIDSPNIAKLGIREGTVFFDGSGELEEIYPSIEGMTAEQLKAAGVPCNSTGALDEIVGAEQMTDNGVGEINEGETQTTAKPPTFKVTLKDISFDINDHLTTETATLSFKTGMLGGRGFEIVKNGCKPIKDASGKVTGYELELNRVYDDSIKLWFPYSAYNAQAGDKFVLLYIEMPEVYIKAAAKRLKEAATEWLSKNDYSRSIYAPKVDENFMARQHDAAMASGGKIKSLHDTLKEGMLLLFEDEDLNIDASIFIDRLTIKEEGVVPTYEVVLKEEKTVGRLDKMQNQIDSLAAGKGQGGGGYSAAQIRSMIDAYGGTRFLSKIKDDRSTGKIASDKGFEVGNFISGVAGGLFGMDANGDSLAEVARLYVRVKAFFEELTVIKSNVLAGKQYITPGGGITCLEVEELDDVYRCYFLSEQDGEKTETKIIAGDQAISEMFNAKAGTANKVSNHRYWRLVTAVSNDAYTDDNGNHYGYIDLSKTDCDSGSDIPQTGDEICQLGYRGTDKPERQTAMIFSTVDSDAPSIKMFSGIGSGTTNAEHYSLAGKVIISFGRDTLTGKIFFRLGATGATQYLEYTQDGGLEIAGAISTKSTINNKPIDEYIKDQAGEAQTLLVEYSKTGADGSWHATFAEGDLYMRQSADNGKTWEGPMRIVGADGERAHTLSVTSAGYGGSMQGLSGIVKVDGVNVISPHSRGLIMVTIDRKTLTKVEQIRYDLYQYSSIVEQAREDFIAKVDELDDSVFVCLLFADNMTWTQSLIEAMKKLGSLGDIAMDGPSRTFAFIGYKGLTPGYALQAQGENQTLPPAEVSTYVADGMFATNKTGADGQYLKYQWAIGTSTSVTGVWSDTPLSALPGQYVWMRSGTVIPPATAPVQWGTPIRLTGDSGKDGESTYLLDLTNETEGVPCDSSGNPTGILPSTGMAVYKGSVKDSGWTFTKDDNGCQSMLTSADTLQITSLDSSANTATVTVTATKAGCPTLTSIMNVYKVLPGQDGSNYSPNLITKERYLDSLDGARLTKAYRLTSGDNPSGAINAYLSGTVRWQLASGIIKEAGWYSVMLWAKREKGEGRFWVDINDCELSDAVIVPEEWTQYKWSVYVNKWLGMYGFLDLQTDSPNCAILISDVTVIPGKNPLDTWIPAASEMSGTNGVGINSTIITYGVSASATVPPTSWLGSIPTVPQGQYLWTRTTITYTDGTSSTAYAVSRQGVNGEDGADGTDGTSVSILSTSVTYQTTKSASKPTGGTWLPNTPALENGDYLWTRTIVNYSDGNSTESFSVSRLGTDGTDGLPGTPGADGRTTYVHMAYASAVTGSLPHPSSVTGFSTSAFAGAAYIGFLTDYNQKDSESFADYDWHEYKGEDGAPATVFRVLPSVDSVTRHADGSLSDLEVSCTVLKTTGASAPVTSNERTLWYQRMPDGASGTLTRNNGVSAGVPVLSDTEAIIFELRNGNMVLDRERVPVLSDLEGFEVGGENMVLNSGFTSNQFIDPRMILDAQMKDSVGGANVLKMELEGLTEDVWAGVWQNYPDNIYMTCLPNTYYSYRMEVYSPDINSFDNNADWVLNVRDENGLVVKYNSINLIPYKSGEWEVVSGCFKTPANAHHFDCQWWLQRNGKLWVIKPQLVRGATLPDWAPSPHDFNYVTEALKNSGSFEGGLLLGSLIKLGYTDENDVYRVMAGLNGLIKNSTGRDLAFWAGGDMIDAAEVANGAATTAIRHDGTAYFARNVIRMLLDHLMVGDNVRLDKEGLKLMVDGDVRAIIHNQPVPVNWNELANNSLPVGTGTFTNVSIPIAIVGGGFRIFIYRSAEKVYDIGTVTANSIGSCLVMLNALQVFDYGHPIKGLWPISEFAYAELRCNGNVVATFALSVSSTVRYNNDIPGNKTNGSVTYECSQNISFTCPSAGNYSLAIVFPGADGSTSDDAKLLSLTCSCSVKGTVKLGLGNQTVIGSDGFVSVWGEAAIGVNKDRAIMRAGNFGLIVDANKGIQYVKNGGTPQQLV